MQSKLDQILDSVSSPNSHLDSVLDGAAKSRLDTILDSASTAPTDASLAPKPTPAPIQEPSLVGGFLSEVKQRLLHPIQGVKDVPSALSVDPRQNRSLPTGTDLLAGKTPEEIAAMAANMEKQSKPGIISRTIGAIAHAPGIIDPTNKVVDPRGQPELMNEIANKGYDSENVGPYTPIGAKPLVGAPKAVAEAVSGLTSPSSAVIIGGVAGAATIPVVGPALATGAALAFGGSQMAGMHDSVQAALAARQKRDDLTRIAGKDPVRGPALMAEAQKQADQVKYHATNAAIQGGMAALTALGMSHEVLADKLPPPGPAPDLNTPEGQAAMNEATKMSSEQEAAAEPARAAKEAADAAATGGQAQAAYDTRIKQPISTPTARGTTTKATPPGYPAYSPEGAPGGQGAPNQAPPPPPSGFAGAQPQAEAPNADGATQEPTQEYPISTQLPAEIDTALADQLARKHDVKPSVVDDILRSAVGATQANNNVPEQANNGPRVEPNPHPEIEQVAQSYNKKAGLPPIEHKPFNVDEAKSKEIAKFYDKAQSEPNNPEVKAAYGAMVKETRAQYDHLVANGYKFEPVDTPAPYETVQDLKKDLDNKTLKVWTGEPPEHGLISPEDNFKFRAVHDTLGHVGAGASFGHSGEELAYRTHLQMYSPEAQKAMATETRGQNAAAHFGESNNAPTTLYNKNASAVQNFPKQKAMILPERLRSIAEQNSNEGYKSPAERSDPNSPNVVTEDFRGVPVLKMSTRVLQALGISDQTKGFVLPDSADAIKSVGAVKDHPVLHGIYDAMVSANEKTGGKPFIIARGGMAPHEYDITIPHEYNHVVSLHATPAEAYTHPIVKKGVAYLANSNPTYGKLDESLKAKGDERGIGNEFIAHAASGEWGLLGLTKEQAAEGLYHAIDTTFNAGQFQAAISLVDNLHPELEALKNELSEKYKHARLEQERGLQGPSAGVSQGTRPGGSALAGERGGEREGKNPGLEPGSAQHSEAGPEQHLTRAERVETKNPESLAKVKEMFDQLPSDFTTMAKIGSLGRYWYENSARALKNYFGDDAPQFTKLLAAYSPRQSVRDNLKTALDAWRDWGRAGRPTDENTIGEILDKHAGGEKFAGRFNNAVRALKGDAQPFSDTSPKVSSFYQNLIGKVNFVTNDVWMSKFAGITHAALGDKLGYLGLSAKVREAAKELGWAPQQTQAAIWVATKALWELGVKGKPPKEVINRLSLKDADDLNDFATIFAKDSDVRAKLSDILGDQGKSLEGVESKFTKKDQPKLGGKEAVNPEAARQVAARLEPAIATARANKIVNKTEKRKAKDIDLGQGRMFQHTEPRPDEEKLAEVNANRKRVGLPPIDKLEAFNPNAKTEAFKKLSEPEFGKEVPIESLRRGFISAGGKAVETVYDHEDSLTKIGVVPKHPDEVQWSKALHANGLVRFYRSPSEIAVEMGGRPTSAQIQAIKTVADKFPKNTMTYDLFEGGRRMNSMGNVNFERFSQDLNRAYRQGERGSIRFGNAPKNPLPKSPEYTKVHEAQNGLGPSPSLAKRLDNFVNAVDAKSLSATRKFIDKWVDMRNIVDAAKKSGVSIAPGDDPYLGLQIGYGGGNGGFAATMLDTFDILKDAKKAKLYPETTAYLNLKANQRAIDVIKEKEAEARAAGQTATADKYAAKLASSEVAAGGFNENSLSRDLKALEKGMTPAQFAQVKGFADREFKLNKEALDFLHNHGRISDAAYRKIIARGPEYVTMTRILDSMDEAQFPGGQGMSVKGLKSIQSLEGSTLINQNPWIADPVRRGLAYREEARMRPVEQLHDLAKAHSFFGNFVRELAPGDKLGKHEGEIAYVKKGKVVRLGVPDVLADAMKVSSAADTKILGQALLSSVAAVVRPSLTGMNLAYAATSPLREAQDTLTYLMRSPKDVVSYVSEFTKAIVHTMKKDSAFKEALRSGVAYTSIQSRIDPLAILRNQDMRALIRPGASITNGLMAILDTIGGANEALQIASKMAARQMMINNGMDPVQATADARTYSGRPDVANAGTMTSQMNPLLLFMTDKLKGAERSWLFYKKFPKYAIGAALAFAAYELAANRYNSQFTSPEYEKQHADFLASDEGKNSDAVKAWEAAHKDEMLEWNHVSDKDRSNYHILLTPHIVEDDAGTLRRFGVKVPRGRAFFGNAARALWEGVFGETPKDQAMLNEVANALPGDYTLRKGEVGSGVVRGLASSTNPLIQEPIEQRSNTDTYTGAPIESEGMQNRAPEYRYKETTSPFSVKLGEMTKASPLRIEHALRNFGGLGEMITGTIDKALRESDQRVPPGNVASALTRQPVIGPIARRFILSGVDQTRTDREKEFYDALTAAAQGTDTIRGMMGSPVDAKTVGNYAQDPTATHLAYLHPDLNKVAMQLRADRVAMADTGLSKVPDDQKRAAVRAIHQDYMTWLDKGLEIAREGKTTNKADLEDMINDIRNR